MKTKTLEANLQTETKKTLYDCVPEKQLRMWFPKSQKEFEIFCQKVDQSSKEFEELNLNFQKENLNLNLLEGFELKVKEIIKQEEYYLDVYKKDYENLIEISKKNLQEMNMTKMLNSHSEGIKILKVYDDQIKETMKKCDENKKNTTSKVYEKLKDISEKQYQITKFSKKMMTFGSILNTLNTNFSHFEMIECLPGAYELSLAEVTRRRKFLKIYKEEIQKSTELLSKLREKELNRRKKFTRHIGKYLPNNLIDGLNEIIPSFDIDSKLLETKLPFIEYLGNFNEKDVEKLYQNSFQEKNLEIFETESIFQGYDLDQEKKLYEKKIQEMNQELNESFNLKIQSVHKQFEIEKEKEFENLKNGLNEKDKILEEYIKKVQFLEKELKEEKEKLKQKDEMLVHQKEIYKNTVNELLENMHELEILSLENSDLKKKFNLKVPENVEIDKLYQENQELNEKLAQKEKLRHDAVLNSAHTEKKLFSLSKDFQKVKQSNSIYLSTLNQIINICQFEDVIIDDSNEGLSKVVNKIKDLNEKIIQDTLKMNEMLNPYDVKISLKDFKTSSNCIFISNSKGHYEAIHYQNSLYFLSQNTIKALEKDHKLSKCVIGKIYTMEKRFITKESLNPYGLSEGSEYYIVDAAIL